MNAYLFAIAVPIAIFVLGVVTGGLSNVTSGGAGLFTIYILTNYAGLVIQESTGTVLAASTVMVLVGAIAFQRKRQVNSFLALTVGLSGVVGAFLAAEWASSIDATSLEHYFGVFTLALALYTAWRFVLDWRKSPRQASVKSSNVEKDPPMGNDSSGLSSIQESSSLVRFAGKDPLALTIQIVTGAMIGIVTGLFGVGLASIGIVLFMLLFRLDMKVVLGTSLFASFFRYLGGSAGYLVTGQIDTVYFLILVAGGVVGSIVGARLVLGKKGGKGIKDHYIKLLIIGILLFISYEYLLKSLIFH